MEKEKMTAENRTATKTHQELMGSAYEKYGDEMSAKEFYNSLSFVERRAVVLGNFNYQVENGGFSQWKCNDYMELHISELKEILDGMGWKTTAGKVKALVEKYEELDEDEQDGSEEANELDSKYYEINEEFMKECEKYLKNLQIKSEGEK